MHLPSDQHEGAEYIVFPKGGDFFARDGESGNIEFSGTDAATVIQNAIDAVAGSGDVGDGGTVYIKPGWYGISKTISLKASVVLQGGAICNYHGGTRLTLADGVNDNLVEWIPTFGRDEFFAGLRDLQLHGNSANNTSGHCLYTAGDGSGNAPKDMHIRDVWFKDAPQDGVHLEACWGYKFSDCLFEANARHGAYMLGGQWYNDNAFFSSNGGSGLIGVGDYNHIYGFAMSNDEHGVYLEGNRIVARVNAWENGYAGVSLGGENINFNATYDSVFTPATPGTTR